MSAYVSMIYPDSIQVLTDGALYDDRGVLVGIAEKVWRSDRIPVAISHCSNHWHFATGVAKAIIDLSHDPHLADFDMLLDHVPEFLDRLRDKMPSAKGFECDFLLAGWSRWSGPSQYEIRIFDEADVPNGPVPPFTLHRLGDSVLAGYDASLGGRPDVVALASKIMKSSKGMEHHGADLMEKMREVSGSFMLGDKVAKIYGIAGHVQLTTIREDSVSTKTLRVWPDKIGEPVNPFAGTNIAPINRAQRRAMKRQQRHAQAVA